MSIGALAVAIMFVLNGFSMSMMGGLKAFALGSVSDIIGQWRAQMVFPQNNVVGILAQASKISAPTVDVPL